MPTFGKIICCSLTDRASAAATWRPARNPTFLRPEAPASCMRLLGGNAPGSEELSEFLYGQTGIANDAAHREGIDWIVARDGENAYAIGHDDVLALSHDAEASLL
jgi:hypothetical protein